MMEYVGGLRPEEYVPIGDNYAGKCIFVTGCTGFLGKVFVEKMLYRCPKIDKVYVLIRETETASVGDRLKQMLDSALFMRLKDERPKDLDKIIPIAGDIIEPNLGITPEDERLLVENVSMVFHFAATVRFNEPLQVSFKINVEGTRQILELSRRMKHIEVFLYVSTAFSNMLRSVVDEVIYPSPIPLSDTSKVIEQKIFTSAQCIKLLNGYPNTYTLSKAIAENLVASYNDSFCTIVLRPSIVTSAKDEPMAGWVDNWFGATALIAAISEGFNRILLADGNNIIDLIPVDYVTNLIIVAAARSKKCKTTHVYNSCSSGLNPITLGQLGRLIISDSSKHKFNTLPMPMLMFTEVKWLLSLVTLVLQTLPSYLMDWIMLFMGKKPRFVKIQSKIRKMRDVLGPFTSRTWNIRAARTSALNQSLTGTDRNVFACDAANINWNTYIPTYCYGIRKFMFNDKK